MLQATWKVCSRVQFSRYCILLVYEIYFSLIQFFKIVTAKHTRSVVHCLEKTDVVWFLTICHVSSDLTGLLNSAGILSKESECLTPPTSDKGSMGSPSDIDSDSNPPSPLSPDDLYTSGKRQRFVELGRGSDCGISECFYWSTVAKNGGGFLKFDCGKGHANPETTSFQNISRGLLKNYAKVWFLGIQLNLEPNM